VGILPGAVPELRSPGLPADDPQWVLKLPQIGGHRSAGTRVDSVPFTFHRAQGDKILRKACVEHGRILDRVKQRILTGAC
jgi:hypothetical protein